MREFAETVTGLRPRVEQIRERRKEIIDAARAAKASGFSTLFGITAVRLWTALEATMHDFILARLEHGDFWRKVLADKSLNI